MQANETLNNTVKKALYDAYVKDVDTDAPEGMSYTEWEASMAARPVQIPKWLEKVLRIPGVGLIVMILILVILLPLTICVLLVAIILMLVFRILCLPCALMNRAKENRAAAGEPPATEAPGAQNMGGPSTYV